MGLKLLCVLAFAPVLLAESKRVIVRPAEISDILRNPGMGIQTFQRFNGDALNEGLNWSEEGPLSPLPRPTKEPDFPASTISYCRWHWSTIEPAKGKIHWEIIDGALDQARLRGQTLAIRLMPYDPKHPLPEWYRQSGARRANKDGADWHPDFTDPLYLKHWGDFVAAAGARYDGHPFLESVDISSVGYWGEGWSDYMPAFHHQKELIDIYFRAFRRTPLLMNFDEQEALTYGTSQGAGWRFDCVGDMRPGWSHMLDFYPQQIARAGIQDVWRRAHISMEACGVPLGWKQKGWNVDYIIDEMLRWHISSLNVKSTAIPVDWKPAFERLERKMGYRFALRRVEYDSETRSGAMMPLKMWWVNEGVAPPYREYRLAFRFQSTQATAVVRTIADARSWLPGDAVFEESIQIPPGLPPGTYHLQTALLDPRTNEPAIRLATIGRQSDGWYDLGEIVVSPF